MSDLNIRNFPPSLLRELKTMALRDDESLRDHVIGLLEQIIMERESYSSEFSAYLDKVYPDGWPNARKAQVDAERIESIAAGKPIDLAPPDCRSLEDEPIAAPVELPISKAFEALAKTRPKVGDKCPHGYMNWLTCDKCRTA